MSEAESDRAQLDALRNAAAERTSRQVTQIGLLFVAGVTTKAAPPAPGVEVPRERSTWPRAARSLTVATAAILVGASATTLIVDSAGAESLFYLRWTAWSCLLALFCIVMAFVHFHSFESIAFDVMRSFSRRGLDRYTAWLDTTLRPRNQVCAIIIGLVLGVLWLIPVIRDHGGVTPSSAIFAVSVLIATCTVSNLAYWIYRDVRLSSLIASEGATDLIPGVPAATVGIQRLSSWFALAALTVTVGTIGYLVPIVGIGQAPDPTPDQIAVRFTLFFVAFLFILLVSAIPQVGIAAAIRRAKYSGIRTLTARFETLESGAGEGSQDAVVRNREALEVLLEVRQLHATSNTTVDLLVISQVALAVVGALVGAAVASGVL